MMSETTLNPRSSPAPQPACGCETEDDTAGAPGLSSSRALKQRPEDDDATLVARCLKGDGKAWEALVHRYQRLVYAVVRRIGLDEHMAADVFQTVFSRLVTQLPKIADPSRLQAWVVTTAKREALLQRTRGQRNVSMTPIDDDGAEWEFADDAAQPDETLDALQQAEQVRSALERLDSRCQALLKLLFSDDDVQPGYDEIAQRLGTPVGSIGPTRARCLGKLRGWVEGRS